METIQVDPALVDDDPGAAGPSSAPQPTPSRRPLKRKAPDSRLNTPREDAKEKEETEEGEQTNGPFVASSTLKGRLRTVDCFRTSSDGALAVVTTESLHILTPRIGVAPAFDKLTPACTQAALRRLAPEEGAADVGEGAGGEEGVTALHKMHFPQRLFHTEVRVNKHARVEWASLSHDMSTLVGGAANPMWKVATWSPSYLNAFGGPFLAALNSAMEVCVYAPTKDLFGGAWEMIQDLTFDRIAKLKSQPAVKALLQLQSTTVSWSPACRWPTSAPSSSRLTPFRDHSLLAVGDSAGEISFWALAPEHGRLEERFRQRVAETSITDVVWTEWRPVRDVWFQAHMAVQAGDGSLRIWLVRQTGTDGERERRYEMEAITTVLKPREAVPTVVRWVGSPDEDHTLAFATPGEAHFVTVLASPNGQGRRDIGVSKRATVRLETSLATSHSSFLSPATALVPLPPSDVLLTLADGSIHLFRSVGVENHALPTYDREASHAITARVRAAIEEHDSRIRKRPTWKDKLKICGAAGFGDGALAVAYEWSRPQQWGYLPDSAWFGNFVLMNDVLGDVALRRPLAASLEDTWERSGDVVSRSPLSSLQPLLLRLQAGLAQDPTVAGELLSWIRDRVSQDESALFMPSRPGGGTVSERGTQPPALLRHAFARALIGNEALNRQRGLWRVVRFILAQKLSADAREDFTALARRLSHNLLRTLLYATADTIVGFIDVEEGGDAAEIQRSPTSVRTLTNIAVAVLLSSGDSSTPPIAELARRLLALSGNVDLAASLPPTVEVASKEWTLTPGVWTGETCAACGAKVDLDDLRTGRCERGHPWDRCALTLQLITTTDVCTCIGCGTKALVPPRLVGDDVGSERGHTDVALELLSSIKVCVTCGDRVIRML